jgi:GT2 family glycosyltransferase
VSRSHHTALAGWRTPSRKRPALRDCSLVIPTCNGGREVERVLDTLLALPDSPGEVVVVDGDPACDLDVRLRAWIARTAAPFALAYVASPPELTRRRNVGVDISTRDFIFFLDANAIPLPGYFAETRRVFEFDRQRCVGGVSGIVVNQTRRLHRLRRALALLPPVEAMLYHRSGAHTPREFLAPFSGLRRVDVLPGCASAWRRDVFTGLRFSCFFQGNPEGEDVEMSLRAGRSWTLLCCGDARVQLARLEPAAVPGYDAGRAHVRNRWFVWKRHVRTPDLRHTARFWCGSVLSAAAMAAYRPRYAAGILAGIAGCITDPPRFVEPPPRREYVLTAEAARAARQAN